MIPSEGEVSEGFSRLIRDWVQWSREERVPFRSLGKDLENRVLDLTRHRGYVTDNCHRKPKRRFKVTGPYVYYELGTSWVQRVTRKSVHNYIDVRGGDPQGG